MDTPRIKNKELQLNRIKKSSGRFGVKMIIIIIMIFFFLIPLSMIQDLVQERELRKYQAEEDIITSWGGEMAIAGPVLIIPYISERPVYDKDGEYVRHEDFRTNCYLLPESLELDARSLSEIKSRGIFDVPVFNMDLEGWGEFHIDKLYKSYDIDRLLWTEAYLQFSYPQLKGMKKTSPLFWDGAEIDFEAGGQARGVLDSTMTVPVNIGNGERENISRQFAFRFKQEISGGASLTFLPLAKMTKVNLQSDWASPSFQGYYLPSNKELTDEGFTAEWEIHSLSRDIPQSWLATESHIFEDMYRSSFGLDFFPAFDAYQKTRRTIDYAFLFLIIPFLTFFLFELIGKVQIHPVQYLLAGCGNILFYLLLLSLSEHIDFLPSYMAAAAAVCLLLTAYTSSIQKIGRKGMILLPVLTLAYGYLYFVLKSEDYALLMGSLGLFAILAVTMFLTRKISWYPKDDEML